MIVFDLNGKQFKWNPQSRPKSNASMLHIEARNLLKRIYSCDLIFEEVYVEKIKVYLDFFIPSKKIVLEVNGEQHYTFNSFMHRNKLDFLKKQQKDREKQEWCKINGFKFIELPFDRIEDWERLIR